MLRLQITKVGQVLLIHHIVRVQLTDLELGKHSNDGVNSVEWVHLPPRFDWATIGHHQFV